MVNGNEVLYSQESHITFWCPMRFHNFPLDNQVCKFKVKTEFTPDHPKVYFKSYYSTSVLLQVGSYAYDDTKMQFTASLLSYDASVRNTILDYNIKLLALKPVDSLFIWESINSNYSLTGYEMIMKRNSLKYIVNYYLPSGLFVLVSWVSIFHPSHPRQTAR